MSYNQFIKNLRCQSGKPSSQNKWTERGFPLFHKLRRNLTVPQGSKNTISSNNKDNGKFSLSQRLSPEIQQLFQTAQQNIMELNQQRIAAQEQLKEANIKVNQLESELRSTKMKLDAAYKIKQQELQAAQQEQAQAQQVVSQQQAPPQYQPPPPQVPQQQPPPPQAPAAAQANQWQAVQEGASAPPQAPPQKPQYSLTLIYESGWKKAYIHFKTDKQGWTKSPGQLMDAHHPEYTTGHVLQVDANGMEFVINNGKNDWDKLEPFSDNPRNYTITAPGVYRLKSGKVHKIS